MSKDCGVEIGGQTRIQLRGQKHKSVQAEFGIDKSKFVGPLLLEISGLLGNSTKTQAEIDMPGFGSHLHGPFTLPGSICNSDELLDADLEIGIMVLGKFLEEPLSETPT